MLLPSWIAWPGDLPCPWNRGRWTPWHAERPQPHMVEVIAEPKDTLHFGPPKTSASRRMVGLAPVRGRRPGRADGGAGLAGGAGVRRAARWCIAGDAVPAPVLAACDPGGRAAPPYAERLH